MIYNKKKAIAFIFEKISVIKSDIASFQEIRTILPKIWQSQGFAILKALISTVTKMF